ncbi:Putative iron compound ABC transporter, permease protein [Candidatus Arthromitus sp. SFB-mouse-SU]|uniref:ABC transporter permease n=1 Tax=unclassified Candidatus Neoarthromitus TaxID=2638829 RepID=UPI0002296921|nr:MULTISPECIES: iron chelate uptake ABC transporter family permease subunit [unclassified Candidatus Arthromitus]EIA29935.1 Putative iron compound ABC transporter, permease protein [Candidatus Arthromitus sp. SFB-mouse-SU]EIA31646.1 Putative iron compound ABC transporter, permease protein [Candidatus Arthromitus sp. SFB-4]AID45125.1 putative iron compound ABC uptake transporter, permease protein [Candidatus Arthromitus sp. SFB-mouse-NL]EGX28405.1 iron complex transport system permease protein 
MKKRYLILILLLVVLSLISLFLGAKNITIWEILNGDIDSIRIFLVSRLPRLISILIAGVVMSICGLIMQQISQNKFVSPTTGATIDSAQLGIMVAMIIFPSASIMQKTIISFVFALIGTFIFIIFLRNLKIKNVVFVPLVGIIFGNIIGSITTFLGYKFDLLQSVSSWMQGNFSMILKGNYELLYLSIPLVIITIVYANMFTVAGMGKDFATNLGLNYDRVVNIGVSIVALATVIVVVTVGSIPFIGLIVPNLVAMYKGDNVNKSIFDIALVGSVFILICDIIGRVVIYPYEFPIGVTVGVIGSILFLFIVLRRNNRGK